MNEYIVYTKEGYTYGLNSDIDIENCQVLGIIEGLTEIDAINKLFEQNDWIHRAGFTVEDTIARPLLTPPIIEDIKMVIDYLWKDEHKRFQENHYPKDHILRVLKRLQNYTK